MRSKGLYNWVFDWSAAVLGWKPSPSQELYQMWTMWWQHCINLEKQGCAQRGCESEKGILCIFLKLKKKPNNSREWAPTIWTHSTNRFNTELFYPMENNTKKWKYLTYREYSVDLLLRQSCSFNFMKNIFPSDCNNKVYVVYVNYELRISLLKHVFH